MVFAVLFGHVCIGVFLNHPCAGVAPFMADRFNVKSPAIIETDQVGVVRGGVQVNPFYSLCLKIFVYKVDQGFAHAHVTVGRVNGESAYTRLVA